MGTAHEGSTGDHSTWPPSFPHSAIDELIERLERAHALSPEDAAALIAMVAKEAQRLRSAVVRLSMQKLSSADNEAREIVEEALSQAGSLKALGLTALERRLDEADRLQAGMRRAFRSELSASMVQAQPISERARLRLMSEQEPE